MKRKLVKQGTSTMMVSLPSRWIKAHDLSKGSEVEILDKDNILEISTNAKIRKKDLKISIKGMSNTAIRSILTNAYRLHYDMITVEYATEQEAIKIGQILKGSLIGFEITSRTDRYCIIENITEPSSEYSDAIFIKMLHNIKQLLESTKKSMLGNGESDYIKDIEENIQRYDNFCRRLSIQSQYATLYVAFYKELAQAQREIYYIAEYVGKKRIRISPGTIKMFDDMILMFEKLREAYQKKDIALIEDMHSMQKDMITARGYGLLKEKKGEENIVLFRILTATRMLYLSVSPLIGLMLISAQEQYDKNHNS